VPTDPAHEFLRLACLLYGRDDAQADWGDARVLLAAHPGLARTSIHVAAADADLDAVRGLLARDPRAAGGRGGPIGWEPGAAPSDAHACGDDGAGFAAGGASDDSIERWTGRAWRRWQESNPPDGVRPSHSF